MAVVIPGNVQSEIFVTMSFRVVLISLTLSALCAGCGTLGNAARDKAGQSALTTPADAHARAALRLLEKGDWNGAISRATVAVAMDPENASLHLLLASAHHRGLREGHKSQGDLAEAGYRVAANLDPGEPSALRHLAALYLDQQRYRAAQAVLSRVVRLDDTDGESLHSLAVAAYHAGDMRTALWAIRKSARMLPDDAGVLRGAAVIHAAFNLPEEARTYSAQLAGGKIDADELAALKNTLERWRRRNATLLAQAGDGAPPLSVPVASIPARGASAPTTATPSSDPATSSSAPVALPSAPAALPSAPTVSPSASVASASQPVPSPSPLVPSPASPQPGAAAPVSVGQPDPTSPGQSVPMPAGTAGSTLSSAPIGPQANGMGAPLVNAPGGGGVATSDSMPAQQESPRSPPGQDAPAQNMNSPPQGTPPPGTPPGGGAPAGGPASPDVVARDWRDCKQRFSEYDFHDDGGGAGVGMGMPMGGGIGSMGGSSDETQSLGALPSPCRSLPLPRMVMVDVVILTTMDENQHTNGLNLLDSLSIVLNGSRTVTRALDANGDWTTTVDRTHSASLGVPGTGVNYSLNIANASRNRVEVLARPTLMALDRKASTFFSGADVTIPVSGNYNGSLQDKQVGTSLSVTPTVLDDDTLLLAAKAARSFFAPVEAGSIDQSLVTTRNTVVSNVRMRFGQSLILSGLREREDSDGHGGVPLLKDIPGLQYLFSRRTTHSTEKSVLIVITPRRVESFDDLLAAAARSNKDVPDPAFKRDEADLRRQVVEDSAALPANIRAVMRAQLQNSLLSEALTQRADLGLPRAQSRRRFDVILQDLKRLVYF